MDGTVGRGHREKKPSEKLKEQVSIKPDKLDDQQRILPPKYIAGNDPRFFHEQKEISKSYDHTKTTLGGEKIDYYALGNHVESRDKRFYLRAQRDPETLYFRAAEAPPKYARFSDENHPCCQVEHVEGAFTKDMLGKTGEFGNYTTRANVFAREGTFFYEVKIVSQAIEPKESAHEALATTQQARGVTKEDTTRGSIRYGFCRREHGWTENLGNNAYSYSISGYGKNARDYGNVHFNSQFFHVQGKNPGSLKEGDVLGFMITLPPLEVHEKVVKGTFVASDYPHLKCGPAVVKPKKALASKKGKSKGKEKEKGQDLAAREGSEADFRTTVRSRLNPLLQLDTPPTLDIIRDRNPFLHKGLCYFECPDYTTRPDLMRPATKGKTLDPTTGKPYNLFTDPHPNHEVTHLRTLPGSKIELWVNGEYQGIVWEHLFAFLPPASYIEKSNKTTNLHGAVDDGLLGYYPAISHYGGGAAEIKFDGPWWFGYEKDTGGFDRSMCRDFGKRYEEQIVEDFCADLVDEVYWERLSGVGWMKKAVESTAAPARQE